MEVKVLGDSEIYVPITLAITFQNLEEAQSFYAIFRHASVASCLSGSMDRGKAIRSVLQARNPLVVSEEKYNEVKNSLARRN